ncbi:MAG: tetratricopeptide repeat protein [Fibromonadaceae bacterium]|jgi:Tfp pilus assembly protein PilF|nr:tetratricopeptide repeat protein [Fibromonadaceae bacterium]
MKSKNAEHWFNEGKSFSKSGNLEAAIKCYDKAVRLKPGYVDAFRNCGISLARLAQIKRDESLFKKAFEKYAKVVSLNPNNANIFNNWGNALCNLAQIKQDESLFMESLEKYTEAVNIDPSIAHVYNNRGTVFVDLAKIKQNKSLFMKAFKEYAKAASLGQNYAYIFYNWGNALTDLAKIKQDKSLFKEAFEKYAEAVSLNPDSTYVFHNWGNALADLAEVKQSEGLLKESFEKFYKESDNLKKLKKEILEILVMLRNSKTNICEKFGVEKFYPVLDSDLKINFDYSFEKATKNIKNKTKLKKYKEVYVRSISVISRLYIDFENEKLVAHYTNKITSQKLLFEDSRFRLNAINHSNDITEGEILLKYLFKKYPTRKKLNAESETFAGCFIFNYDSLNQFRLYGKENGEEGTGMSLVFRDNFFSKEAKISMKLSETEGNDSPGKEEEKYTLFRCMYIDPITRRVETVGHKEAYLFFREKNENESNGDIDNKVKKYRKYITDIIENVREEMDILRKLVKGLDSKIVGQLLISLRYLTKHIAFKEEQECRILRRHDLKDKKNVKTNEFKQIYVEYKPEVFSCIERIYFGPKATGIELFQDFLIHHGKKILYEKSANPLA